MRVLVDTNILIRLAIGPEDPAFEGSVSALEVLRDRGDVPTLFPQNLYEFWVVATRPVEQNGLGLTPEEAAHEFESLGSPLFRILLDERGIFDRWKKLIFEHEVRGKPAHDARLVAGMLRHGLTTVLTLNPRDFSRYEGAIVVVTPEQLIRGE